MLFKLYEKIFETLTFEEILKILKNFILVILFKLQILLLLIFFLFISGFLVGSSMLMIHSGVYIEYCFIEYSIGVLFFTYYGIMFPVFVDVLISKWLYLLFSSIKLEVVERNG